MTTLVRVFFFFFFFFFQVFNRILPILSGTPKRVTGKQCRPTSSGPFYHNSLDWSISNSRESGKLFLLLCFIEIPVFNANSVDPDQMLSSAASDMGLHSLPIALLGFSN